MHGDSKMRINQFLARCGVCSRRDADNLIKSGAVKINGKTAGLGEDASEKDEVTVNGRPVKLPDDHIVMAYYKPVGVTCTERDSHAERLVTDEIKADRRLTYAGRLDKDSEGLLLMTDDGELINAMMRGANLHEKEYVVKVNREIKKEALQKMADGIYIPELKQKTRPCRTWQTGKYTFKIILTQGLNRQIRRMCEITGMKVVSLKRTRVMNIELANLQVGASRNLTEKEKIELYELCGLRR